MINADEQVKRFEQIKSERGTLESHWQECLKYSLPQKAFITRTKTLGQKLDADVYDSTAINANLILAAGLHSYLTNPASKWFALRTQDKNLMKDKANRVWLKDAENKIFDALNGSNFAQQIHECYLDLGSIGTSTVYVEDDLDDLVRFYTRSMGECYLVENEKERVDTMFRKFCFTARQAYSQWGGDAGNAVKKAMDAKDYTKKLDFLHVVLPRYDRDVGKSDGKNMSFASAYIEISEKHLISESGYEEFPFMTPRFMKETGEAYGTSPTMVSLPDIKQLNNMSWTIMRAAQVKVDPPLSVPHDGFLLPIRFGPRAINFKLNSGLDPNAKIEAINAGGDIGIGMDMENQRREVIQKNFHVDLFLMLAQNPNMTATEVLQRVQEKMLILAPVLGRLMSELLDPIIGRVFNILLRRGMFGPVPEALQRYGYIVEYTSPLARAQKSEEIRNIQNFLAIIAQMSSFAPSVLDKVESDKAVDIIADVSNVTPEIIRDDEEVKVIRDSRAKAQADADALATAAQGADIAAKGAQAISAVQPQGGMNAGQ